MTLHDWVVLIVAILGVLSPGIPKILAALPKSKPPAK